jgi:hypothetical protein
VSNDTHVQSIGLYAAACFVLPLLFLALVIVQSFEPIGGPRPLPVVNLGQLRDEASALASVAGVVLVVGEVFSLLVYGGTTDPTDFTAIVVWLSLLYGMLVLVLRYAVGGDASGGAGGSPT